MMRNFETKAKIIRISNGEKIPILIYSALNNRYVWSVMVWIIIHRRFRVSFKTINDDIHYLKRFYNYCSELELSVEDLIYRHKFEEILNTFQNYCSFLKLDCNNDGYLKSASLINKSIQAIKTYLDWVILYNCKDKEKFSLYRETITHIKKCNILKIKADQFITVH